MSNFETYSKLREEYFNSSPSQSAEAAVRLAEAEIHRMLNNSIKPWVLILFSMQTLLNSDEEIPDGETYELSVYFTYTVLRNLPDVADNLLQARARKIKDQQIAAQRKNMARH